jgi:trans-L-3-hydroxyproline dehydratase
VTASALIEEDRVRSVSFRNVPSFVIDLDQLVDVPGIGQIRYDLAFGGGFYAYVNAADVGLKVSPDDLHALIDKGMAIKRAIMSHRTIPHPFEADLSFLYGTIFVDQPQGEATHSRNVCIFAEGEVDRSPTGTGVSGRLAIHHARGEIGVGEAITIESIIGSSFRCSVVEECMFGPHRAIIPEVAGSAFITGRHEFLIDPNDPLKDGFVMR